MFPWVHSTRPPPPSFHCDGYFKTMSIVPDRLRTTVKWNWPANDSIMYIEWFVPLQTIIISKWGTINYCIVNLFPWEPLEHACTTQSHILVSDVPYIPSLYYYCSFTLWIVSLFSLFLYRLIAFSRILSIRLPDFNHSPNIIFQFKLIMVEREASLHLLCHQFTWILVSTARYVCMMRTIHVCINPCYMYMCHICCYRYSHSCGFNF